MWEVSFLKERIVFFTLFTLSGNKNLIFSRRLKLLSDCGESYLSKITPLFWMPLHLSEMESLTEAIHFGCSELMNLLLKFRLWLYINSYYSSMLFLLIAKSICNKHYLIVFLFWGAEVEKRAIQGRIPLLSAKMLIYLEKSMYKSFFNRVSWKCKQQSNWERKWF